MKTLILGEVIDNKLSSGTLEIINKANSLSLEYKVVTVGSSDAPVIGSSTFDQTYIKRSAESLQFNKVADKLSQIIQEENIDDQLETYITLSMEIIFKEEKIIPNFPNDDYRQMYNYDDLFELRHKIEGLFE